MTADIDAETPANRTSDTSSSTTTETMVTASSSAITQTNNNNNFMSTSSSISVSNAVSKIDALLNANNGGIGANFPRNNARKLKSLVTMPSIEVSTSVPDTAVMSDVTSECSSADSTSVAAPLPTKKRNSGINTGIPIYSRDAADTNADITKTVTRNDTKPIDDAAERNQQVDDDAQSVSTTARQEINYTGPRSQLARPDNQYIAIPNKPLSNVNNKNQMQHIHHHHHHHHQHKQLSPTQKGKHKINHFFDSILNSLNWQRTIMKIAYNLVIIWSTIAKWIHHNYLKWNNCLCAKIYLGVAEFHISFLTDFTLEFHFLQFTYIPHGRFVLLVHTSHYHLCRLGRWILCICYDALASQEQER